MPKLNDYPRSARRRNSITSINARKAMLPQLMRSAQKGTHTPWSTISALPTHFVAQRHSLRRGSVIMGRLMTSSCARPSAGSSRENAQDPELGASVVVHPHPNTHALFLTLSVSATLPANTDAARRTIYPLHVQQQPLTPPIHKQTAARTPTHDALSRRPEFHVTSLFHAPQHPRRTRCQQISTARREKEMLTTAFQEHWTTPEVRRRRFTRK